MTLSSMQRSHSLESELGQLASVGAGPSHRRSLQRSTSETDLQKGKAGSATWDDDFASALLGLQGASRQSRKGKRKEATALFLDTPNGPRKGILESLGQVMGLSPPTTVPAATRPPAPQALPGETPQSRHMRKTLQSVGPRIAANALEATSAPQIVRRRQRGCRGACDDVDSSSGSSWSSDGTENYPPHGVRTKRDRRRAVERPSLCQAQKVAENIYLYTARVVLAVIDLTACPCCRYLAAQNCLLDVLHFAADTHPATPSRLQGADESDYQ